ncbi:hypothetical protein [Microbacterium rhizomatis]|uniref:Uncharacterized protein n=1 Tax=Microbacterium rhizomatis TaxID=1631477 RepID=A0A5J5J315_9MICO|nr:hypothetical protein [Microbacterium rhizomatis]KAA9107783.1 hypothetical protein F6B43_10110 [Microbacterium rhizomatis]
MAAPRRDPVRPALARRPLRDHRGRHRQQPLAAVEKVGCCARRRDDIGVTHPTHRIEQPFRLDAELDARYERRDVPLELG